jgi:DNA-directed RNA polymerase specialized sigma subunit
MMQEKQKKQTHPAKVYLSAYPAMKKRLEDLKEELEYIRETATRATSKLTAERVSGTSMKDGMANAVIKGIETEERLQRTISNLSEALTVRLMLIEELPDEWEKLILTERYINGKGWNQIIKRIPYSEVQAFRMHGFALNHYWEIYKKHQNDSK